ncbi:transporter [Actinoplanes sp. ATCC 53533]|uniref:transporter n=1 Tax=Actinoplanes sp. ATCC 53533 TaxID=1288362 RepID=UPI000F76E3EC|nr:transporter [Actinoplanes sp. ATCC 53533]RSM64832.1 transporter [Actinoplanes sp. ATCC 53533]
MEANQDELPPGDPAESLRMIARERAATGRRLTPDPRLLLWPWGLAWLIGFGVYFLRFGPDERVYVDMPAFLPLTLLLCLITLAGVITGVVGARAGRLITGPTSRQGAMYGFTWSVAFCGMAVLLSRVSSVLPVPSANLLWAGAMVALTGALHMAGGAMWNDRIVYVLGVSISVVNVVGIIIGPGWHALIVAVFGGGGMLVAGLVSWLRMAR